MRSRGQLPALRLWPSRPHSSESPADGCNEHSRTPLRHRRNRPRYAPLQCASRDPPPHPRRSGERQRYVPGPSAEEFDGVEYGIERRGNGTTPVPVVLQLQIREQLRMKFVFVRRFLRLPRVSIRFGRRTCAPNEGGLQHGRPGRNGLQLDLRQEPADRVRRISDHGRNLGAVKWTSRGRNGRPDRYVLFDRAHSGNSSFIRRHISSLIDCARISLFLSCIPHM